MKGVFALLAVASLCACGGSGGGGTTAPPNNGVNTPPPVGGISVNNDAFSPGTKTVPAGTTLKWAWNSCTGGTDPYGGGQTSCVQHSVTFDDGSASSPLQDQGIFEKTFNTPGTYTYHCMVHGSLGMTGTITVQ
jgi:plastocyanin